MGVLAATIHHVEYTRLRPIVVAKQHRVRTLLGFQSWQRPYHVEYTGAHPESKISYIWRR